MIDQNILHAFFLKTILFSMLPLYEPINSLIYMFVCIIEMNVNIRHCQFHTIDCRLHQVVCKLIYIIILISWNLILWYNKELIINKGVTNISSIHTIGVCLAVPTLAVTSRANICISCIIAFKCCSKNQNSIHWGWESNSCLCHNNNNNVEN